MRVGEHRRKRIQGPAKAPGFQRPWPSRVLQGSSRRGWHPSADRESVDGLGDTLFRPLIESSTDGAVRASEAGETLVARAVDQREHHMLGHGPLGDPTAVPAERVVQSELRSCGQEFDTLGPRRVRTDKTAARARPSFVIIEKRFPNRGTRLTLELSCTSGSAVPRSLRPRRVVRQEWCPGLGVRGRLGAAAGGRAAPLRR